MDKKIIALALLLFFTSCVNPMVFMPGAYGKGRTGPGKSKPHQYKYRCEKVGQCCEVGKDCEEDLKQKESIK